MWYQFPVHIGLALVWAALWGSFGPFHLTVGALVGGAVLQVLTRGTGQPFYLKRVVALIRFVVLFLWHVVLANIVVARVALAPKVTSRPGIVALPLRLKTEGSITALMHMMTLTPDSVPVDISQDRTEMYIHCLDLNEVDALERSMRIFEDLLFEVTE